MSIWNACRPDNKGEPDDIVVSCDTVHIERMDNGSWWVGIYRGEDRVCFSLDSKNRIKATKIEDSLGLRDDSGETHA